MNTLGLVVHCDSDPMKPMQYAVFVESTQGLLFVPRGRPYDMGTMSKEEQKSYEKEEKRKALSVGDWIRFNIESVQNRKIKEYEKEYRLAEVRFKDGYEQLKTLCVFKPSSDEKQPVCYTEVFGTLKVTPAVAQCFLPNVAYKVWVNVGMTRVMSPMFTISDFIEVCPDQSCVYDMLWNLQNKHFIPKAPEAVNDDSADNRSILQYPEAISARGVLVGHRSIHAFDLPGVAVSVGYVPPGAKFDVGQTVVFNAVYSAPLAAYVTARCRVLRDQSLLPQKPSASGTDAQMQTVAGDVRHAAAREACETEQLAVPSGVAAAEIPPMSSPKHNSAADVKAAQKPAEVESAPPKSSTLTAHKKVGSGAGVSNVKCDVDCESDGLLHEVLAARSVVLALSKANVGLLQRCLEWAIRHDRKGGAV